MDHANTLTMRELTAPGWEARRGTVVLLPVGSQEQHGPGLPMSTDTLIAEAVAVLAAEQRPGRAIVAPSVPYGVSFHHHNLPGAAISISAPMLANLLVELTDALLGPGRNRGVILVNGHGGNRSALGQAIDEIGRQFGEQPVIAYSWWEALAGDSLARPGHSGRVETAIIGHLHDQLVDWELLRSSKLLPRQSQAPPYPVQRWIDCSRHDPSGITDVPPDDLGDLGQHLVTSASGALVQLIDWLVDSYGLDQRD